MKCRHGIPNERREIHGKSQALNYCLLVCNEAKLGCAVDCEIRERWKIPPQGEHYYEYYDKD